MQPVSSKLLTASKQPGPELAHLVAQQLKGLSPAVIEELKRQLAVGVPTASKVVRRAMALTLNVPAMNLDILNNEPDMFTKISSVTESSGSLGTSGADDTPDALDNEESKDDDRKHHIINIEPWSSIEDSRQPESKPIL